MADDEAEHSRAAGEPDLAPGSLQEAPVSAAEQQQPQAEPEAAGAKPLEHAGLSADVSLGPAAQSENQIPSESDEPEAVGTSGQGGIGPESAPAPAYASRQAAPRLRFAALAATAIAGGVLGVGGALALRHFEGPQSGNFATEDQIDSLNARLAAIEGKVSAASTSSSALANLEARVGSAENAANKATDLANSLAADLQKQLASQPAGQESAPATPAPEPPDLGPVNARIDTLEQKIASLQSAMTAPKSELRAHPQERESPVAAQSARAQAIAVVAQSILQKVESGAPFSDELAALKNLGVSAESLAALRAPASSPIPSEHQLSAQFRALAPAIIASDPAKHGSPEENFLDRVTRHAKDLVHIHRSGESEEMDVESLVTRIEKALADHDLEGAYQTWSQLPSPAITASQSWGDAVKARLDAINAARTIETDAVAVLGKSKS